MKEIKKQYCFDELDKLIFLTKRLKKLAFEMEERGKKSRKEKSKKAA